LPDRRHQYRRSNNSGYAYQELSPYTILLTGPTTVANLFYNMASGKMGYLVGLITHAAQPAMRSPNPEREPVSITSDAERPMPNAWGNVPGSTEGE